eukprot:GEMP01082549.1.p1 GENE.GEMP01082549.1~~GEMP01082549.1.p1  ORF type:complete len:130 (-),score=8.95 GEMP01082549.1:78-467(-)
MAHVRLRFPMGLSSSCRRGHCTHLRDRDALRWNALAYKRLHRKANTREAFRGCVEACLFKTLHCFAQDIGILIRPYHLIAESVHQKQGHIIPSVLKDNCCDRQKNDTTIKIKSLSIFARASRGRYHVYA